MINTTKEIVFFEIKNNEKIFSEKQSKKKKKIKLTLLIECVQFTYLSLLLLNIMNPFSPSLDKIKTKSLCCEIILPSSFFLRNIYIIRYLILATSGLCNIYSGSVLFSVLYLPVILALDRQKVFYKE